ncbi:MAG: helix-turn-helix domain protein [Gammaproteobacteria bacterium]|jgi:transcriptional regulator with XRE-family HTH domain|nr:helix-turn-helix domain protein [Gammaproteobacteria bacterium]
MGDSSAIARGKRLKRIRQIAGLTRDELAALIEVSKATLSYWENASLSRLSDKGAGKVIKALAKYGVNCSLEWLLLGIGNTPQVKMLGLPNSDIIAASSSSLPIFSGDLQAEIDLFQSLNSNSVITTLNHAAMSPIIEIGDTIGGIWQPPSSLINTDKIYIVSFDQQLQVRKVKKTAEADLFDLSYISYSSELTEPFEIKAVRLDKLAPIMRIWRS